MAYEQLFEDAGRQFNVDPALLRAQMMVESGGNPNAKSEKNAMGLMQIIPETQKALGVTNPNDPQQSIFAAARLMAENLDRYGNVADAVKAYHGGTDQANWGPKTQAYVNKVLKGYGAASPAAPESASASPADDLAMDFAPSATMADGPDDDLMADFLAPAAKPAAAAAPAAQTTAPAGVSLPQEQGSLLNPVNALQALGAQGISNANAIGRGISDVLDAPSEWLAAGAEKTGLTNLLGRAGINMPTEAQQIDINKQSRADYDARNADGGLQETVSRVGGNILGTAAPIAKAGQVLSQGGNALLGAMRASPSLAGAVPAAEAAGNFVAGNSGLLSRMANLGIQGGAGAALLSGASDTPLSEQVGVGAALGSAIPAGAALLTGGRNVAQSLVRPFTEGGRQRMAETLIGQEARAAQGGAGAFPAGTEVPVVNPALQAPARAAPRGTTAPTRTTAPDVTQSAPPIGPGFSPEDALTTAASGGRTAANFDEIIPGSRPTLAQATGNAGIAALERAAISRSPNAFNELQQANNAARMDFFNGLRGNTQTLDQAIAQREETAIPMLKEALAGARPANANPVVAEIDSILASPDGKRAAVRSALGNVKQNIHDASGNLETDVAQLYGVRKSINDQLERVAGKDQSEAQQASKELLQVKAALDKSIEQAAPGFKDYLKQYSALSKPVTSQSYLQGLELTDQTSSALTLSKVKAAISKIEKARKGPGASEAKDLSDDQLNGLKALHADLQREANSAKGMARGSNTFQNLATNQLIEAMGGSTVAGAVTPAAIGTGLGYLIGGPGGAALGGVAGSAVGNAVGGAVRSRAPDVEAKLINLLLNPNGAQALKALEDPAANTLLNRVMNKGAPAIFGGSAKNR